ncbi:DUF4359 domain-containing protein [Merismopedia glauca]|uniref:DUF4359 domain-containing protein n=2 Tax=Merismopedia TaxID=53402 RepID=A0A2T1C5F8_9CYAN|nr:DUF4359 domain-containing protein [Merismopedia glauca]PSB03377.1 hypothetical protein C7B64_08895 [Merismopedia glauca CCAP 1448/3]
MKGLVAIALVGLGLVMVVTNPSSDRYADYAVTQIQDSQNSICPSNISIFGTSLQNECKSFINNNSNQIKQVILQTSDRQNILLFSIYKTDLSVSKLIPNIPSNVAPGYEFETIGAFGHFLTYQAEAK